MQNRLVSAKKTRRYGSLSVWIKIIIGYLSRDIENGGDLINVTSMP